MKKCPFCAEEIQDEAVKCKHCGSDLKTEKKVEKKKSILLSWKFWAWTLGILFIGMPIVVAIVGVPDGSQSANIAPAVQDNRSPAEKYFSSNIGAAKMTCEDAVKKQLKTPSKADFSNVEAGYIGSGSVEAGVMGDVDSQNSYGAMIRSKFVCKFKWNGKDFYIEDVKVGK